MKSFRYEDLKKYYDNVQKIIERYGNTKQINDFISKTLMGGNYMEPRVALHNPTLSIARRHRFNINQFLPESQRFSQVSFGSFQNFMDIEEEICDNIFKVYIDNEKNSGYGLIDFYNCKIILPCKHKVFQRISESLKDLYEVDGAMYNVKECKFLTKETYKDFNYVCNDRIIASLDYDYYQCLNSKGKKVIPIDKAYQIDFYKDFEIFIVAEDRIDCSTNYEDSPEYEYLYGIYDINGNKLLKIGYTNYPKITRDGYIITDGNTIFDIKKSIYNKETELETTINKINEILNLQKTSEEKLADIKKLIALSNTQIDKLNHKTINGNTSVKQKCNKKN